MPRRVLTTIFLVVIHLTFLGHAFAQGTPATTPPAAPPPSAAQTAEAKKYFDAGMKFYKDGQHAEALAAFIEADRLAPRESTQRNIAQTHRDLHDMASAYRSYEALLTLYGDHMKLVDKADVQRALDELAVLTGVVSVTIVDAGAMVNVDGKDVGAPPRSIRLNVGPHTVVVTKPGFERIEQKVDFVGRDAVTVAGPLVPTNMKGRVSVTVQPTDAPAIVNVDGLDVGPAPWRGELDRGPHTITARSAAGAAQPAIFEVMPRTGHDVALTIRPAVGTLTVNVMAAKNANVADAAIRLDDVLVANGAFEGPVLRGHHSLEVVKPGYLSYRREFDIRDGERLTESVALVHDGPTEAEKEAQWRGVYARFDVIGMFATAEQNNVADGSAYDVTVDKKDTSSLVGGGLGVRVGYSFGIVGVEGIANATYDHAAATISLPADGAASIPARTDKWDFHRVGGTFAFGGRIMAKHFLRPTFGLGIGFSTKSILYQRAVAGTSTSNSSNSTFYVTPTILMDAGIELGGRGGARFFLGAMMHVDVPTTQELDASAVTSSNRSPLPMGTVIRAATGPEVFVGPVLGFRFGS